MSVVQGQFDSPSERVKSILVEELRSYFRLKRSQYAQAEKPNVARFGVYGDPDASDDSAVQIDTALPHADQRIPCVMLLALSGTEKKMGIGRQVVHTYHDTITGLPMMREAVGMDVTATFEITAGDTNTRSQLVDHVVAYFGQYAEESEFAFLGNAQTDERGDQNLYQIIVKNKLNVGGESDVPRPEGEGFERLYINKITVPFLFVDYIDREAWDVDVIYNPALQPIPDPDNRFPLGPPKLFQFVTTQDFEFPPVAGMLPVTNSFLFGLVDTQEPLNGNGSWRFEESAPGGAGLLMNSTTPGVVSGKIRTRFAIDNQVGNLVIACMVQSPDLSSQDPFVDASYHLIVQPGSQTRMLLMKGPVGAGIQIAESSRVTIPVGTPGAVQLQWRIDVALNRILLQAFVAPYSMSYLDMRHRLEFVDTDTPFLTSLGEGVGFLRDTDVDQPDVLGIMRLDDIEICNAIG